MLVVFCITFPSADTFQTFPPDLMDKKAGTDRKLFSGALASEGGGGGLEIFERENK